LAQAAAVVVVTAAAVVQANTILVHSQD